MIKLGDEIDQGMIHIESFELNHSSVHLLYGEIGWIVHDGGKLRYYPTFLQASRAMDELILAMLGEEEK